MMAELRATAILSADGKLVPAQLQIDEEDPANRAMVRLSLRFEERELVASEPDFFSALCTIRQILEQENLLLNCYGSSRNVYPSAMSRDMGGEKAYKLKLGRPARTNDLVSIFDSGPDVQPTSIEDQLKFYHEWLNSLG